MVSRAAVAFALVCAMLWLALCPARAVEAVNVRTDASAIDLTLAAERPKTESDRVQVSTAPGPDGIVRRIEVRGREAGKIRPVIDSTFPLEKAAEAHARMESSAHIGKIVLTVG